MRSDEHRPLLQADDSSSLLHNGAYLSAAGLVPEAALLRYGLLPETRLPPEPPELR